VFMHVTRPVDTFIDGDYETKHKLRAQHCRGKAEEVEPADEMLM
jgi:hypothetical protein